MNLAAKCFVHQANSKSIDESLLLTLNPGEKLKPVEKELISFLILVYHHQKKWIPTKSYIDSVSENDRSRRETSIVFNSQDNVSDKYKVKNLDSVRVNRNPSSDE